MLFYEPLISIVVYSIIVIFVCFLLLSFCYFLIKSKANYEKHIAYECGFKPFDFIYYPFDVQFYRVGILFLLFDVEIIFFFPWLLNFYQITLLGHSFIFIFILLLLLGFIYEIKINVLIWYPKPWHY